VPTAAVNTQKPTVPATSTPTMMIASQLPTFAPSVAQPTTAPTIADTNTISVSISTVISNITVAEFNQPAFTAAVVELINTAVVPTAAAAIRVILTSAPQATTAAALSSDSSNRHLQVTNNSVTVAYDVTNIPDTATANVIQTQLSSTDSKSKLLNRYKTLDSGTSATAITTTVLTKPFNTQTSGSKSTPIGAIIGAVIGVLVVAVIVYIIWRKRHSCTQSMPEKQVTTTDKQAVVTNDSINNMNSNSNNGAFSKATVADNPRRNISDRRSGSMLIDMDSGIGIDSVHDDVTRVNDDVEHGTAGANTTQHDTPVLTKSDTAASGDLSSDLATGNSTALAIHQTSDEASDTDSELAGATKNTVRTKIIGRRARFIINRITSITQKAVEEHGDKAVVAWELVGAVAEHIPFIKDVYGLLDELAQLFGAAVDINDNCRAVVAWVKHMQVYQCICYISHHNCFLMYISSTHSWVIVSECFLMNSLSLIFD
jgi:hypothetical protein